MVGDGGRPPWRTPDHAPEGLGGEELHGLRGGSVVEEFVCHRPGYILGLPRIEPPDIHKERVVVECGIGF